MKGSLYELTNEVENLYLMLEDSIDLETGEIDEQINKALEVKESEFNDKAVAVATVWRRYQSRLDLLENEIARLTALKNKAKAVQGKLEYSLTTACERLGKEKIEGISANISFRKSDKTIIDNEEIIPEDYFNITMVKKPNLTEIKKAIKNGVEIPGARIETRKNIQIK